MKITEKRDKGHYPTYILEVTQGEIMALWQPLENKRLVPSLGPVGYDCWLQLNRIMATIAPTFVKESK